MGGEEQEGETIEEGPWVRPGGQGEPVAYLHEHCQDCKDRLGREWLEVHQWLDGLYAVHGHDHRQHRHHAEGVEEIRGMWGDEAALAAQIHIIVDCWGIPAKADYETGRVNRNGFTPESTEADVARLLAEKVISDAT